MSVTKRQILRQLRTANKAATHRIPAPIGGLNTRDALDAMPETDAIILDNLFPQTSWVEVRSGRSALATFTGNCETLMNYAALGAGTNELFGAVNHAGTRSIFRVDNAGGGAVGAAVVGGASNTVQAITSTRYDYVQFGTGAAEVLYLVNGADPPLVWDGSSWYPIATTGTYALTGGPSPLSSLRLIAAYKQRLWFVQSGTFNVYYLPQNDIGGALTLLNIAPNFMLGGYIQTIITVSIDNTAGTNDYIAFISGKGEVVMFQGYDPSSASTWGVAARFRIGAPIGIGRQCWQKMGMDAAIICEDGLILLSQAMLTDRSQTRQALSDKIRFGLVQALYLNASNPGWQLLLSPIGNKLILNVPTSGSFSTSYQFVMNTLGGNSWATWGQYASPLNAFCWELFQDELYFGTAGSVQGMDQGQLSDAGSPIQWQAQCAYSYMDDPTALKRYTQCQPLFQTTGNLSLAVSLNIDFSATQPTASIPLSNGASAPWGTSYWTVTYWTDAAQVVNKWLGLAGEGFCAGLNVRGNTSNLTAKWLSTLFMYEQGGAFYGK